MYVHDKIQFTINKFIYLFSLIITQNINYNTVTKK